MFGVECFDTHDEPISHYTQWDINQTLKIVLHGMDAGYMKNAPYVHFANIKSSEALVVPSTLQGDNTIIVDIPNILLQELWPLLVYVYLSDSTDASSQRTIVKIEIPVHKRARPSNYEYVENIDRITAEVIKQEIYDDIMDEVHGGNIAYPYVTFIDESTGKHVNLKVSDEKFGLYVDSTNRQLLDTGDIVNNLMTDSSTKVLSASMGAAIKNMVDVIPDNIDEKIEGHDSSPTSHSDIRDDISSMSSAVDTMQDSIAEIEDKIGDVSFMLDDTISGSGILTTTDTLVDSSPIEMRIKGNTRQNLWVNPIATRNGITISNADDGAITISGSATATTTVTTDKIYTMKAGVTYSIGADKLTPVNGFVFSVHQYSSEDRLLAGSDSITSSSKGRTITTNAQMAYVKFVVAIPSGASVSETYHIMLNVGEELEPWCAPGLNSVGDDGSVKIVTAGKNLWVNPEQTTINGITVTPNADGSINVSGSISEASPSGTYFRTQLICLPLAGERVTASVDNVLSDNYARLIIQFVQDDGTIIGGNNYIGYGSKLFATYTVPVACHHISMGVYFISSTPAGTAINTTIRPQLEPGSTATAYEPPNVTTTPLPKVELRSLPNGTCDEMVIKGDGTCEVERRTKKVTLDGGSGMSLSSGQKQSNNKWVAYIAYTSSGVIGSADNNNYVSDKLKIANSIVECAENVGSLFIAPNGNVCIGVGEQTDSNSAVSYGNELLAGNPSVLVCELAKYSTEPQTSVTLPSFPSDKSNIYATSNVPTAGLTVRYWKKGGELVANLYDKLAQLQNTINSIQEAVTQS